MSKSREDAGSNIKVVARFRPIISIEAGLPEGRSDIYTFPNDTTVQVDHGKDLYDTFIYDKVYSPATEQEEIFEFVGKPIIQDVLTGYNGTVFAYGQTGSGKSHTMMGLDIYDPETQGIIPRASGMIFQSLNELAKDVVCTIKCSMLEIYKETLKDLLGNNCSNLKIKESPLRGIYVQGLSEEYVCCEEEMMEILSLGESNRTVASTKMNKVSSRSHQLFIVEVTQKLTDNSEKRGIMNLVDLAGCEKVNQTGVTGNKLEEAKKINLSLSALGNVIHSLTSHSDHIPYRDSKLTRLLQESLGGNYKTTLIVNCSPHPRNIEDTLNTLKFAQRVKTIKNKAKVNMKKSPEALMRIIVLLKKEITDLKAENERNMMKYGINSPMSTLRISRTPDLDLSRSEDNVNSSSITETFSSLSERYKILFDDHGNPEQVLEELNSLRQDKENLEVQNKELNEDLINERKKRLKTEMVSLQHYEMWQKTSNSQKKDDENLLFLSAENESLKRQISGLEYQLKQMSERFKDSLYKIKSGDQLNE